MFLFKWGRKCERERQREFDFFMRRADPHISYHIIALGHGSHTATLLSGGMLCCRDSSDLLCYGPLRRALTAALRSLKDQWQNTPPSWGKSGDPCVAPWEGVTCNNSRVTALGLSSMGLIGKLSGDIGGLTELRSLDLSFNQRLTGSISSQLGDLQKLNILILAGCGFSGNIPNELGNLVELTFFTACTRSSLVAGLSGPVVRCMFFIGISIQVLLLRDFNQFESVA
ncbi:unnamed protein product [Camellia sinensis]